MSYPVDVETHQTILRPPPSPNPAGWISFILGKVQRLLQGLKLWAIHARYTFFLMGQNVYTGDEFTKADCAVQICLLIFGALFVFPLALIVLVLSSLRVPISLEWVLTVMRLPSKPCAKIPSKVSVPIDGSRERWFFLNGIATTERTNQAEVDGLATMFNHEVIGLRNKSFGLMIDVWCCLIQRDSNARTPIVYDYLSIIGGAMLDPSSVRVIVFAHSQGALIFSAVVKLIEREAILQGVKHKVEMYTIGSAARSFGTRKHCGQEVHGGFGRVEHYSNEWDWVARTGVLSNIEASVGVHYIRKKQAGHLPLIHYFPDDRFLVSSPGSKLATYLKSVQNKRRARKARRQKAKHA